MGVGIASLATFCIGCLVFIVVICYRLCWLFMMYGCVCCLVLFYSCCFVVLALCYSIYLLVVALFGVGFVVMLFVVLYCDALVYDC